MSPARPRHFLAPVVDHAGPFILRVGRLSAQLASDATLAGDSRARRRGLLGRDELAPGEALVIAPTQGIHTFGMRCPIDVAFVDRAGTIVAIAAQVPPRRVRLAWRAFAAVELRAGACGELGLALGDVIDAVVPAADPAPETT